MPQLLCEGMKECNIYCCSHRDLCNMGNGNGNWMQESDPVNWLYIAMTYLILPSLFVMAKMVYKAAAV